MAAGTVTPVTIEAVEKKSFATAVDWPGWSRSGKDEEAAIAALVDYAPRYAVVAKLAHQRFPAHPEPSIVQRLAGDGSTSFGVPGKVTEPDHEPLTAAQLRSRIALLRATWDYFEQVASKAPAKLRKGPRGGGRDTADIIGHVVGAESGYARQIGIKMPAPAGFDDWGPLHDAICEAIASGAEGKPIVAGRKWTARYATHRIAWHALDHAWEIEDKSEPA
jgi:hypothetical protein